MKLIVFIRDIGEPAPTGIMVNLPDIMLDWMRAIGPIYTQLM